MRGSSLVGRVPVTPAQGKRSTSTKEAESRRVAAAADGRRCAEEREVERMPPRKLDEESRRRGASTWLSSTAAGATPIAGSTLTSNVGGNDSERSPIFERCSFTTR